MSTTEPRPSDHELSRNASGELDLAQIRQCPVELAAVISADLGTRFGTRSRPHVASSLARAVFAWFRDWACHCAGRRYAASASRITWATTAGWDMNTA
jgi:hypothetical protein